MPCSYIICTYFAISFIILSRVSVALPAILMHVCSELEYPIISLHERVCAISWFEVIIYTFLWPLLLSIPECLIGASLSEPHIDEFAVNFP